MVTELQALLMILREAAAAGDDTAPIERSIINLFARAGYAPAREVPLPPPRRFCIHLGTALDSTVKTECKTCDGKKHIERRVYECAVHGRCLANFTPASLDAWNARKPESDIYKLCSQCPDRKFAE